MKSFYFGLLATALALSSCGGGSSNGGNLAEGASGNMDAYVNSNVHAIEQARPAIMILPSDNLLERYGALSRETIDGRTFTLRDYAKYLLANDDNKSVISVIQNAFVQENYPLQDLEQMLKQLDTQEATDMADGMDKDAKTMLLTTAQPDIILELDYRTTTSMTSHDLSNASINFTLNAIDPYTNKVISSTTMDAKGKGSTREVVSGELKNSMPKLTKELTNHFSDILTRGREVTVRLAVANGCNVKLSDASVEGDTYTDWMIDCMKSHTVKGAYKMQRNTDKELYFVDCRIGLLNEDGTQYGVYDWTRDFCKNLRKNLGLNVTNKAQGLGEVLITINGL